MIIGNVPIAKPVRRFISYAAKLLKTKIAIGRDKNAPLAGNPIDRSTYAVDNDCIAFPAHYIGLLKDFIIAGQCLNLLIKGAAAQKELALHSLERYEEAAAACTLAAALDGNNASAGTSWGYRWTSGGAARRRRRRLESLSSSNLFSIGKSRRTRSDGDRNYRRLSKLISF